MRNTSYPNQESASTGPRHPWAPWPTAAEAAALRQFGAKPRVGVEADRHDQLRFNFTGDEQVPDETVEELLSALEPSPEAEGLVPLRDLLPGAMRDQTLGH